MDTVSARVPIGALAKRTASKVETIRYYERIGCRTPWPGAPLAAAHAVRSSMPSTGMACLRPARARPLRFGDWPAVGGSHLRFGIVMGRGQGSDETASLRGEDAGFRGHTYVERGCKGFRTVAWTEKRRCPANLS
jgi:hypothetical protein